MVLRVVWTSAIGYWAGIGSKSVLRVLKVVLSVGIGCFVLQHDLGENARSRPSVSIIRFIFVWDNNLH